MGSPESEIGRYSNECQHRVKIEQPFAIGQYAVTFDEYDHFCAATVQWKPEDAGWGRGNRPVINVSWRDALDYTEWLSARTGQVYRLPTEAEWEYTARAGTETAFWWGDSITINQANYGRNHNGTVPVDRFQPNLWGLYQVHGNVWEWTSSCYDEDYGGTEMRYVSKNEVGSLAVRGGSWNNGSDRLRSAYRNRHTLTFRSFSIGFRLVRSL
ncbi:MAG: formylglycine-generating enzyme family protein [Candidatus Contendobacter sp.]|nr:formylglycine-generating enzyme family protein [Candidatus Contendobacter sp.]